MHSRLFRHKLIVDAIISVILFSLAVCVSMIGVSLSCTRVASGFVYASLGVPVSMATVSAFGSEGSGYAATNSLGQYSITEGLKTGTYTVSVIAQGYLNANKENVSVIAGQETVNINFYLNRSGGISGKVTDAFSGVPLQNIMIAASTSDGGDYGWYAVTDANGNYSIIMNLATGTYNVTVIFPEGHIMKSLGGIAVTAGSEVKGIDLALEQSGIISGRVTATPSDAPLGNATVYATSGEGNYFGYTQTNATGYYRISSGLGTGTYTVMAMYLGMNIGYATDVSVVAGTETFDVNIAIPVSAPSPSGIITGKVTDTITKPIANALVTAEGPAGGGEAHTDSNGDYVISSGLRNGTFTVFASAPGYSSRNVSGVIVTEGQVTSNINFQLPKIPPAESGRISGTVQGEENAIPEFQQPIIILLVVTLVAAIVAKLFNVKTRRYQLPPERNIN